MTPRHPDWQHRSELLRCSLLKPSCENYLAVPRSLTKHLGMNASRQHQRIVTIPQIVEPVDQPCTLYYFTRIMGQGAIVTVGGGGNGQSIALCLAEERPDDYWYQ